MAQLSFGTDKQVEDDIIFLKQFFGARSSGAAVRCSILLARAIARCGKNGAVQVLDQNTGVFQTIKIVL